jgi:hypothetical protein
MFIALNNTGHSRGTQLKKMRQNLIAHARTLLSGIPQLQTVARSKSAATQQDAK